MRFFVTHVEGGEEVHNCYLGRLVECFLCCAPTQTRFRLQTPFSWIISYWKLMSSQTGGCKTWSRHNCYTVSPCNKERDTSQMNLFPILLGKCPIVVPKPLFWTPLIQDYPGPVNKLMFPSVTSIISSLHHTFIYLITFLKAGLKGQRLGHVQLLRCSSAIVC